MSRKYMIAIYAIKINMALVKKKNHGQQKTWKT
jgi:hypothetical protein